MRIIAGEFKSRRFNPPAKNWPTRPTTDMSKESLFNILQNRIDIEDTVMLDLYGGTGNHCFEFISRGCQDATYVDNFGPAMTFVKKMSVELGIESRITIIKSDVLKFIQSHAAKKYDFIFADPPYDLNGIHQLPDLIFDADILAENGSFVLEHESKIIFSDHDRFIENRKYGQTVFSFFE